MGLGVGVEFKRCEFGSVLFHCSLGERNDGLHMIGLVESVEHDAQVAKNKKADPKVMVRTATQERPPSGLVTEEVEILETDC